MARVVKPSEDNIAFEISDDEGQQVCLLKGGKRRAYLWCGATPQRLCTTISGEKALRALAMAILKEVGRS